MQEKTILKKRDNDYYLLSRTENSETVIGTLEGGDFEGKISLANCRAIEYGFSLYDLAKTSIPNLSSVAKHDQIYGFEIGFLKCLETNKFTIENLREAFAVARHIGKNNIAYEFEEWFDIHMKQQTEWEVEIEMEYVGECKGNNDNGCFMDSPGHNCGCIEKRVKLSPSGCLILKKI